MYLRELVEAYLSKLCMNITEKNYFVTKHWVSDKLFDGNLLKTAPVKNVTCASLRGANISFPCDIKAENFV